MDVPNNSVSKYMRQKTIEFKVEIDCSIIINLDFNFPLSGIDRSSMHKISKDIDKLNSTINQLEFVKYSNRQWQNVHSLQALIKHSL